MGRWSLREKMQFYENSVGPNQYDNKIEYNSQIKNFEYNNLIVSCPVIVKIDSSVSEVRDLTPFFQYLHADIVVDFGREIIIVFYPDSNMIFNGNIQKLIGAVTRVYGIIDTENKKLFVNTSAFNILNKDSIVEYLLYCGNKFHKNLSNSGNYTQVLQGKNLPSTFLHQTSTYDKKMWVELLKF